jgi:hypothetical protein
MKIRKRMLPVGWYPDSGEEIKAQIMGWEKADGNYGQMRVGRAGVVPHAGWFFSGKIAWRVFSSLGRADTVVILGGHLSPDDGPRGYDYEGFETPLGVLEADLPLLEKLRSAISFIPDKGPDNTVEIQLPLVKYAFPRAKAVCLRVPPSGTAIKIGRLLASLAESDGLSLAVIGSTDLTHYGPNYGFQPRGPGPEALEWVRNVNDRDFIRAMEDEDTKEILRLGTEKKSACSAGAAAGTAAYAEALGFPGKSLEYGTSCDTHPSESFVGYGAVLYGP